MKVRDEAMKWYFYYIQERMNIWWKRYEGKKPPFTKDPVFLQYKFTNVYRCLDRVSQYLIKDVIYGPETYKMNEEDMILRILLFKIFNKIETWEAIEDKIGIISTRTWNLKKVNKALEEQMKREPIFSNAYMLTGMFYSRFKGGEDKFKFKHERYTQVLNDEMMNPKFIKSIVKAKKMEDVYKAFLDITYVAKFLAYQYATDINYSTVTNFDEDSFVMAGKGAIRGINKVCDLGSWSHEDFIRWVQDNLEKYQEYYGFDNFKPLPGRGLKLIDLQNCACEADKILRVKNPAMKIYDHNRERRIKNKFKINNEPIDYFFPPKWGDVMGLKNK